ncbi:chromosomal replication initiation protein DnaA [Roseibium algicola]|jgi:chromosomal replication initiator protein|uniref:Chromosomal replication initiator protein DnaA n=1 Tax=Roseibium algicola TaxID=2857014 RepID=A0ABM6I0U8_9HYPH|nr:MULTISPECIES: chromosomal replication initiator protein DnaA [Stappiaceae]MCR9283536.1 chromosomal replication initiator protein DnaA [Paracoccaceae bacterium]MEC9402802.1 chromosomal replication initiator protein DnaA [Pseudomonadota bacterium]AQQ03833.1 chromosomal replication initiation protein DnaA [Roseibium aggregatum]MBN8183135.1 chromosomal replication initiator protein DnaA [Roseibium aggregatum]MEE2868074.1 chromosomal replication initiator protein DnaA [Pseudomonadota bacterium]
MQVQEAGGSEQWKRVKKQLRAELGDDVFTSWFARVDLEEHQDGTVRLSVPTRFLKQWIQNNYNDQLMGLWQRECDNVHRIELTVRGAIRPRQTPIAKPSLAAPQGSKPATAETRSDALSDAAQVTRAQAATAALGRGETSSDNARDVLQGAALDPKYTFETFVEGESNNLALAAARQVAAGGAVTFNPLYLHASVGLGKTHLMQAVAAKARASGRKVLYLTAEHFMYKFVAALKSQSALAFKENLRTIDLLLIDDMQFLHGKQVQQEFCHTLNALIDGARQVIVAADRAPSELDTLDDRVRSRLSGGLVVGIQEPDFALRRNILATRVDTARKTYPQFDVPEGVLDYVARHVASSGRDLEGALNRLIAHNQLTNQPITQEMAEMTLRDLVRSSEPRRVKIEDIQRVVSKHYNVTKADLLSARRTRTIVRPRQIAMYLAKVMTPRSLPEIGRRFGNRDHTTVLHAVRKIEEMARADYALAQELELLKRMLDA